MYNHGPMVTKYMGLYYMSWYNAPVDETTFKRSVYATSVDGKVWSPPAVLFPEFNSTNDDGEENGPWTILGVDTRIPGGRLYTQSGTLDAGMHLEGIVSVMRQVGVGGDPTKLGQPFWLNRTVPAYCTVRPGSPDCKYPTYLEMDPTTRRDAEQLLASFVRTTVVSPDATAQAQRRPSGVAPPPSPPRMEYNERSLYKVPGTRDLVLLLRGKAGGLSVSMCTLPPVATVPEHTLFSCRPGVGDAFMNLVELAQDYDNSSNPRVCNWSAPLMSTLPDAGSRTCAAPFPAAAAAGVYLVGNQIDKGRDPVTLSVARDGRVFDAHWAVRAGVPGKTIDHGGSCPRWKGHAKCCGYQYPGAMVDAAAGEMIVSYSIGKEDIAFTRFQLSELHLPQGPGEY